MGIQCVFSCRGDAERHKCGAFAMAWHYVLAPLILFIAGFFGYQLPQLPEFDMASLMTVLMGMLGLGGLRTVEKINGVAK